MQDKNRLSLSSGALEKLRFVLIGGANTGVDFLVLNLLVGLAGVGVLLANLISTFVAMCFSLVMNRSFVFKTEQRLSVKEAVLFVLVTLTGIWGVQTAVIFILTQAVPTPLTTIAQTIHSFDMTRVFEVDFLVNNGAKVMATVFSLTWNYVLYKYVVFVPREKR